MSESYDAPAHQSPSEAAPTERKSRATGWLQPVTLPDAMYGSMHVAGWAAALLETAPFQRLAGVSLSDVPGLLLFGRPFPSRLDHAIGVYHLTRLARPRDRALQASALAHDLGHGPFSHLTEPLMVERLGIGHEQRSRGWSTAYARRWRRGFSVIWTGLTGTKLLRSYKARAAMGVARCSTGCSTTTT